MKLLLITLLLALPAYAKEHEHDNEREHCEREPVREVSFHEPAREPVTHEHVILHRDLREHDLRENCHNQWMTDQFCKERVAK